MQPAGGTVILDLHIVIQPGRLAALRSFLRRAIPFYEQPGGIRTRLLQDRSEPSRWIERVEYADERTYERDQRRVNEDPAMKALLAEWRALLDAPPAVHVYREVALNELAPP